MKHYINEALSNLDNMIEVDAVANPVTAQLKKDIKKKYDAFKDMTETDDNYLGAKKQPIPKKVEVPKINLDESLFDYNSLEHDLTTFLSNKGYDVNSETAKNYIASAAEYIVDYRDNTGEDYSIEEWYADTQMNYPEDFEMLKDPVTYEKIQNAPNIFQWNYSDEEVLNAIKYCEDNNIDYTSLSPIDFEEIAIKVNNLVENLTEDDPTDESLNEMARDSQIRYDSKVIIKPSQGTLKYLNDEDRQALKSLKGKTGTVTDMIWEPGNRWDRTRGHYLYNVEIDETGETWVLVAGDLVLTESLTEELSGKDYTDLKSDVYNALSEIIYKYEVEKELPIDHIDISGAVDQFIRKFFLDDDIEESLKEDYTLDDLYKNNGVINYGDFTIELGKLYNKKSKDYSGGFGKLTTVHNKDFSVDKTFKSPEKALAFFNKSISNNNNSNKNNESLNEDTEIQAHLQPSADKKEYYVEVKFYDNYSDEDDFNEGESEKIHVWASNKEELENILNNDEYVEWWDYVGREPDESLKEDYSEDELEQAINVIKKYYHNNLHSFLESFVFNCPIADGGEIIKELADYIDEYDDYVEESLNTTKPLQERKFKDIFDKILNELDAVNYNRSNWSDYDLSSDERYSNENISVEDNIIKIFVSSKDELEFAQKVAEDNNCEFKSGKSGRWRGPEHAYWGMIVVNE